MPRHRIGIDLGGTKIEGILLHPDGSEAARLRVATPIGDYAATVAAMTDMVARLETHPGAERGNATVGVGIPGTVSPATGLVKNANSTWLIGKPLDRDLETALGRPVRLANDANCFAVSEAVDGAAAGVPVVFGVILGTGVGGGLAIRGEALAGVNAIAGEWGHNPLPWPADDERPGHRCYCGLTGCIETFLSGSGFTRDYACHGGTPEASAPEIVERARAGETPASAALARYVDRLARALASVINLADPDVVVLGGGLSNVDELYTLVPEAWGRWVFSDTVATRLVRNRHGDSSGVRGAAWLWAAGGESR